MGIQKAGYLRETDGNILEKRMASNWLKRFFAFIKSSPFAMLKASQGEATHINKMDLLRCHAMTASSNAQLEQRFLASSNHRTELSYICCSVRHHKRLKRTHAATLSEKQVCELRLAQIFRAIWNAMRRPSGLPNSLRLLRYQPFSKGSGRAGQMKQVFGRQIFLHLKCLKYLMSDGAMIITSSKTSKGSCNNRIWLALFFDFCFAASVE